MEGDAQRLANHLDLLTHELAAVRRQQRRILEIVTIHLIGFAIWSMKFHGFFWERMP